MIVLCGNLTILLFGLAFHCFVIENKKSLCNSFPKPSRSDFVQVEFIQLVGITESELDAIRESGSNISILIEKMKKDNPELITDMKRKKSYL